jgi:hypothetical protein
MRLRATEQAENIGAIGGIATEQPVTPKAPEIAWARDGLRRRFRRRRIGMARRS